MLTAIWDFLFRRPQWKVVREDTVRNVKGEEVGSRFTLQCSRTGNMKFFNNYTVDMLGNGSPAPRNDFDYYGY